MRIDITVMGMCLEAEINVTKGWKGSYWEPPEPDEIEIEALYHDNVDVSFMLDSRLNEYIEEATWEALAAEAADAAQSAAEARAEQRMEERMCQSY